MSVPQEHLNRADAGAVATAFLAFFNLIPWPQIAAFLACVYTLARLISMLVKWWKER